MGGWFCGVGLPTLGGIALLCLHIVGLASKSFWRHVRRMDFKEAIGNTFPPFQDVCLKAPIFAKIFSSSTAYGWCRALSCKKCSLRSLVWETSFSQWNEWPAFHPCHSWLQKWPNLRWNLTQYNVLRLSYIQQYSCLVILQSTKCQQNDINDRYCLPFFK